MCFSTSPPLTLIVAELGESLSSPAMELLTLSEATFSKYSAREKRYMTAAPSSAWPMAKAPKAATVMRKLTSSLLRITELKAAPIISRPENRMTARKIAWPYSTFFVKYSTANAAPNRDVEAAMTRTLCFSQTDSESSGAWTEQSSQSDESVFTFMLEAHSHQFADMLVRERVVHYPALTSRLD